MDELILDFFAALAVAVVNKFAVVFCCIIDL
jgi:hypothetical protein